MTNLTQKWMKMCSIDLTHKSSIKINKNSTTKSIPLLSWVQVIRECHIIEPIILYLHMCTCVCPCGKAYTIPTHWCAARLTAQVLSNLLIREWMTQMQYGHSTVEISTCTQQIVLQIRPRKTLCLIQQTIKGICKTLFALYLVLSL